LEYDTGIAYKAGKCLPTRRHTMTTELFLITIVAVLLYGLINSTEKVLSFREQHKEESKDLIDYHSRL
jgi:hypothetical protein